jgi:hypothetical protein
MPRGRRDWPGRKAEQEVYEPHHGTTVTFIVAPLIAQGALMRFDTEQFVNECRSAISSDMASLQIREIVARAVSLPELVLESIGNPTSAGHQIVYRSQDLTILNVVWGAKMMGVPHDHRI